MQNDTDAHEVGVERQLQLHQSLQQQFPGFAHQGNVLKQPSGGTEPLEE